jgi:hypothetical protein
MFHLAFSTGGEHASSASHSIARAQSRGFEPRRSQLKTRLSRRSAIEPALAAIARAASQRTTSQKGPGRDSFTFRKADAEISVALQGRLKVTQAEGLREAVNCGLGFGVSAEWLFMPAFVSFVERCLAA